MTDDIISCKEMIYRFHVKHQHIIDLSMPVNHSDELGRYYSILRREIRDMANEFLGADIPYPYHTDIITLHKILCCYDDLFVQHEAILLFRLF